MTSTLFTTLVKVFHYFLFISFFINLICIKNKNHKIRKCVFYSYLLVFLTKTTFLWFLIDLLFLEKLNYEYKKSSFSIEKSNEPVIPIVLDGLSSSEEIFRQTKDLFDLKFDFYLKKNGYDVYKTLERIIKNHNSLPSLFNSNLYNSIDKDSIENVIKGYKQLMVFKRYLTELISRLAQRIINVFIWDWRVYKRN